jgi:hypothetical protein
MRPGTAPALQPASQPFRKSLIGLPLTLGRARLEHCRAALDIDLTPLKFVDRAPIRQPVMYAKVTSGCNHTGNSDRRIRSCKEDGNSHWVIVLAQITHSFYFNTPIRPAIPFQRGSTSGCHPLTRPQAPLPPPPEPA